MEQIRTAEGAVRHGPQSKMTLPHGTATPIIGTGQALVKHRAGELASVVNSDETRGRGKGFCKCRPQLVREARLPILHSAIPIRSMPMVAGYIS